MSLTKVSYSMIAGAPINVLDYGADPTGVANSSSAIQTAIDAAFAAGGGVVEIPKGVYICKNVILKAGVTLTSGAGMFGYLPSTISNVTLRNTTDAGWVIDTSASACAAIIGINFQGSGASTPAIGGVRIRTGTSWAKIANCNFSGFADSAVQLDSGSIACVVQDILIVDSVLNRTRAGIIGAIDIDGADHMLDRIEATPSLLALTGATQYICGVVVRGTNCFLNAVIGEIADTGIVQVSGGLCRYVNCRADLNFGYGFRIVANGGSTFSNCHAIDNSRSAANTYSGFLVDSVQANNLFVNCYSTNLTGSTKYCFEDNSVGALTSQRSQWSNCSGSGYGTAMYFGVSINGASITQGNAYITDAVTGSHTVDVTNAGVINATSATSSTITNFTGGTSGQSIRIFTAGTNITIANGSGIVNCVGGSQVLIPNRIYTFTLVNGTWYESAYNQFSASALITTNLDMNNGAGVGAGTLTNAPTAGNPTKWVPFNDNGTTRYIPTWT